MKAEVLVLPSSCQLSAKPPKILRCLPFFNTDFWHAPKYFVSRQVLTIWTNLQSIPSYCCLWCTKKFFLCLHPEVTADPEDANHVQNSNSSLTEPKVSIKQGMKLKFHCSQQGLAHRLFGFILSTLQPKKFKFSTKLRSFLAKSAKFLHSKPSFN